MLNVMLALSLLAPPMGQDCPSGKAEYVLPQAAYVLQTASLAGSPIRVTVLSEATGAQYDFEIATGNGYSADILVPMVEGGSVSTAHMVLIYGLDEALDFYPTLPRDGAAPAYIQAPELGRMLWYEAETLGGPTMASGVRENLPRGFFRFQRCLD